MRVALDGTPLLGRPTGVGRYVAGLVSGLAQLPDAPDLTVAAFTMRGARSVPAPAGVRVAGRPFPARGLQALWSHTCVPPVEWFAGRCEVFHATNFVLPPTRRAAGVVTVHDLSFALHPDTVTPTVLAYRRLVPRGIARAAVVLTLTRTGADEVAEHYRLPPERVLVARPGVDPAWLDTAPPTSAWRTARGLPPRYLLYVGTVEPRKNLPVLLSALGRLHAEPGADVPPLVLAGPAGWGAPLDTTGLPAGAVHRAGYLDDAVLRTVVAGASALVYPSRHEGFGLPPLEALACGTPVVSSDLPVLREVTAEQASYAPVGDIDGWASTIGAVLADDGGPGARTLRRAHAAAWTWGRCASEAMVAYRRAAAGGSR